MESEEQARDVDLQDEHGRATRERIGGTGEGILREKESARATRERISREDERFPDKNSWVHYFRECQVKNVKHLEMNLFLLWQNV